MAKIGPDQISGGTALGRALARISPARSAVSPLAMFRSMERSGRGREFLNDSGVSASVRTQQGWLSGETSPSAANSRAIREAYDKWSGANARKRAESNRPGSTRIEIYPSAGGADQYGRGVRHISITDADLGRAIEARNRGDVGELDRIWDDLVDDQIIDSPPGKAYHKVAHVFIGG